MAKRRLTLAAVKSQALPLAASQAKLSSCGTTWHCHMGCHHTNCCLKERANGIVIPPSALKVPEWGLSALLHGRRVDSMLPPEWGWKLFKIANKRDVGPVTP